MFSKLLSWHAPVVIWLMLILTVGKSAFNGAGNMTVNEEAGEALRFMQELGYDTRKPEHRKALHSLNNALASGHLDLAEKNLLRDLLAKHLAVAGSADVLPMTGVYLNHMRCLNDGAEETDLYHMALQRFMAAHLKRLQLARYFRCLEWAPMSLDSHLMRSGLTRCQEAWSFVHADTDGESRSGVNDERLQIRGDLRSIDNELPLLGGMFDLIFCELVLEHVEDPFASLRSLEFLLSRGGILLLVTPFISPFHGAGYFQYPDFFRYTTQGVRALLERSGLQRVDVKAAITGALYNAGYLLGVGDCEYPKMLLETHLLGDNPSQYSFVFSLAVKNMTYRRQRGKVPIIAPQGRWKP